MGERESAHKRGYTKAWQRASKGFLAKHRWCRMCRARGISTPATETDHITPHNGDKRLFWNKENWQPLCKNCHTAKTRAEQYGTTITGCDQTGQPADPDHHWNKE